jgi:hypothetical protein
MIRAYNKFSNIDQRKSATNGDTLNNFLPRHIYVGATRGGAARNWRGAAGAGDQLGQLCGRTRRRCVSPSARLGTVCGGAVDCFYNATDHDLASRTFGTEVIVGVIGLLILGLMIWRTLLTRRGRKAQQFSAHLAAISGQVQERGNEH